MKNRKIWLIAAGIAFCAGIVRWMTVEEDGSGNVPPAERPAGRASVIPEAAPAVTEESEAPEAPEATEEEVREDAEEALVNAFDDETDRWMDSEKMKPPTLKEVDAFVARFKSVPKSRQEECLHRALNLIPDENIMLLAGILMDKTVDKETAELIFNDILNRDESVKGPILKEILKDKTHPCRSDAAWILDVTGG